MSTKTKSVVEAEATLNRLGINLGRARQAARCCRLVLKRHPDLKEHNLPLWVAVYEALKEDQK